MQPAYSITQAEVRLSESRPVRIQRLQVGVSVPPHDHDYYEICLVLSGQGIHVTASEREQIGQGSIVAMPPGVVHAFCDCDGLVVINIYYLSEWLLGDLRTYWPQPYFVPLFLAASLFPLPAGFRVPLWKLNETETASCLRESEDLETELGRPEPSHFFLKCGLQKCFIVAARAFSRTRSNQAPPAYRHEVGRALDDVENCLQKNLAFRVSESAERVGVSPDHLGRIFRLATGKTLNAYYQQRRVQMACAHLLDSSLNITEVGHHLGYADSAHFTRLFKRFTGRTPRAWRRHYLQTPSPVEVSRLR